MLEQMSQRVATGTSFAFETTLSGRAYAHAIPKWQSAGYEVQLHFLSLHAAEHSVHRVASRVARGGHHIPTEVIHRRFDTGVKNFYSLYRDSVDYWSSTTTRI